MSEDVDFNSYRDDYRSQVDDSISFSGKSAAYFIEAKALMLEDLVDRRLGACGDMVVLDVGCGPGETDAFLEGSFRELHGVDIAEGLIQEAARRNPWAHYQAYSDSEPLPYPDDSFDVTFTICVMHHVMPPRWLPFVSEMSRVTRPGGVVAVFEHNPYNPLTRRAVSNCEFDRDAVLLSRRKVGSLLRGASLRPVEARYILFVPVGGSRIRRAEAALAGFPLGAQHYVAAQVGQ